MASLLSWIKKAKDQIDPFDGGKTWSNPNPRPAPPQRQAPPLQRAGFNPNIRGPQGPVQMGQMEIHNPGLAPGPESGYKPDDLIRDLLTRPLANLAVSYADMRVPGKQDFRPTSGIGQAVFGKEPITSYQDRYAGSKAVLEQNNNAQVRALAPVLAGLGQGVNIAADLPAAGALLKGAQFGVEGAVRGIKTVPLSQRIPLGEAGKVQLPLGPGRSLSYSNDGIRKISGKANDVRDMIKGLNTPLNEDGFFRMPKQGMTDEDIMKTFAVNRRKAASDETFYDKFVVKEADKPTRSADLAMEIMEQVEHGNVPINKAIANSLDLPAARPKKGPRLTKLNEDGFVKIPRFADNKNVEMVSTKELSKYMEHDRAAKPLMSAKSYQELKDDIAKNGIKSPLNLSYHAGDRTAYLGEGNHRLAIAKELGLKEVPVEVSGVQSKSMTASKNIKVPGREPDRFGYVPSNQKPSQIGIKTTQKKRLLTPLDESGFLKLPGKQPVDPKEHIYNLKEEASSRAAFKESIEREADLVNRRVKMGRELDGDDKTILQLSGEMEALGRVKALSGSTKRNAEKQFNSLGKPVSTPKSKGEIKAIKKQAKANVKDINAQLKAMAKARNKSRFGLTPLDEAGVVKVPNIRLKKQKEVVKGENPLTFTDKAIRQTDTNLDKLSPGFKGDLSKRKELGDTIAGNYKSKLVNTSKLKKEEELNYAEVLEGKAKPMNENVAEAAKETRKVLNSMYYHAKGNVPNMKGRRQNYFPRMYDPKTFVKNSKQYNKTAQGLVDSGKAKNLDEAEALIMKFKPSNKRTQSGNLTKSRVKDLPGYAQNREAIEHYIDKTAREIAHYKTFGKKEAVLGKHMRGIKKNWGDDAKEDAQKMYNRVSNINQKPSKVSSGLTNFQGATKLGTSSILNATQSVQTATLTGGIRTAKSIKKAAKPNAEDALFLKKANVADDQVAHEQLFAQTGISTNAKIGTKKHNVSARSVMAPGFEAVEKLNRKTAALAGRDLAQSLAKKAAKGDMKAQGRLINEFGISKWRGGKLTIDDQIKAGRNIVKRTQYHTNPEDLPMWMSSNPGKVLSQFKRYPYKQAQFIGREVIKPAMKGNLAPAARLGAYGTPVALGAHEIQGRIRGSDYESKNTLGKVTDIAGKVTGGDLVTSTIGALNPDSYDSNAYVTKVAKLLGGPTVSDGIKLGKAAFDASKGNFTEAARFGLTHVPVGGTPLSNRLMPYNNKKDSKPANPNKLEGATIEEIEALDKKETEAFKKANNKPEGNGLNQLSSGKYIYKVGEDVKVTDDLKKARTAIAQQAFEDSGENSKVVGQKYFYRNENGDVKSMPKYKHEFDVTDSQNQLDMYTAKEDDDPEKWWNAATSQIKALETLRDKYNKDSQEDKVDDVQKRIETLKKQMKKYHGYGGFTKGGGSGGRSGGGGSRGGGSGSAGKFITSGLDTSKDLKIAKPQGIKVRKLATPGFKAKTKKISVNKMPTSFTSKKIR